MCKTTVWNHGFQGSAGSYRLALLIAGIGFLGLVPAQATDVGGLCEDVTCGPCEQCNEETGLCESNCDTGQSCEYGQCCDDCPGQCLDCMECACGECESTILPCMTCIGGTAVPNLCDPRCGPGSCSGEKCQNPCPPKPPQEPDPDPIIPDDQCGDSSDPGCLTCSAGGAPSPGSGGGNFGSVEFWINLGAGDDGESAGALWIKSKTLGPELAHPRSLKLGAMRNDISVEYDYILPICQGGYEPPDPDPTKGNRPEVCDPLSQQYNLELCEAMCEGQPTDWCLYTYHRDELCEDCGPEDCYWGPEGGGTYEIGQDPSGGTCDHAASNCSQTCPWYRCNQKGQVVRFLKKVETSQITADIAILSETSYSVQIKERDTQAEIATWTITYNGILTLTQRVGGNIVRSYQYANITNGMELRRSGPNGLVRRETLTDSEGAKLYQVYEPVGGVDTLLFERTDAYTTYSWGGSQLTYSRAGDLILTREYYDNANESGRYGRPKSWTEPNGAKTILDYDTVGHCTVEAKTWLDTDPVFANNAIDQSVGFVRLREYAPTTIHDATNDDGTVEPHQPRTIIEKVNGAVVSKVYYAYYEADSLKVKVEKRCPTAGLTYSDSRNLTTIKRYQVTGTRERLMSIEYPDGRKDTYEYLNGGFSYGENLGDRGEFITGSGFVQRTITHETTSGPVDDQSTRDIRVTTTYGRVVLESQEVWDGSAWHEVYWKNWVKDATDSNLTHSFANNGTHEQERKTGCCGLDWRKDAGGTKTEFEFDEIGRITSEIKKGVPAYGQYPAQSDISTSYTRLATGSGYVKTSSRGSLSSSQSYNLGGQVVQTTDEAGLSTSVAYTPPGQGGQLITVTYPGGTANKTIEYYLDGRIKSITGTAVISEYYTYGVNVDGTQWTEVHRGGSASSNWERRTVDLLGRVTEVRKPGFEYALNSSNLVITSYVYCGMEVNDPEFMSGKGRVKVITTTGMPPTVYEYGSLGEVVRSGQSTNGNNVLETASKDRIRDTETAFENISGNWWQVTQTWTYATNDNSTQTLTGSQRQRLTGFAAGVTQESVSVDIHGNETVSTQTIDWEHALVTQAVDYPDSTNGEATVSYNGLVQSVASRSGSLVTYEYDSLGRQIEVLDGRFSSPTVTNYHPTTGRVNYVVAPDGVTTSYIYDDDTGRLTGVVRADGSSIETIEYREYTDRGEILRVWGAATYPVQYEYDSTYGWRTGMRTYQDQGSTYDFTDDTWPDPSAAASSYTEWQYEEATGYMIAKKYHKTDQIVHTVSYRYTLEGKIKQRTWARGDSTDYSYYDNPASAPFTGELSSISYDDGMTWEVDYTYTRTGQFDMVTDILGIHEFTYDQDTLQLDTETIDVGSEDFNRTIKRSYETAQAGALGRDTGLAISPDGQSPWEYQSTYGYESATGRINKITGPGLDPTNGAAYTFVPNGHLKDTMEFRSSQNAALAKIDYTYEYQLASPRNRELIASIDNTIEGTPPRVISRYSYRNDELSRRTYLVNEGEAFDLNSRDPWMYRFGYNDRSELGAADRFASTDPDDANPPALAEVGHHFVFDYDKIGNRETFSLDEIQTPTAYTANKLNQYDATTGPAATLTYDQDGNLTSDGRFNYTWDGENRLMLMHPQVPAEGDRSFQFLYDYMGRRVLSYSWTYQNNNWQDDPIEWYIYDGWNVVMVMRVDLLTPAVLRKYTWGLDLSGSIHGAGGIGGLLAAEEPQTTGESKKYWYLYDGNGNVGQLLRYKTSPSETVTLAAHYEYDPYGSSVLRDGNGAILAGIDADPNNDPGAAAANPFRFSTKWLIDQPEPAPTANTIQPSYDLYYFGYRYYSPWWGRWTNRDPVEEYGGPNLHTFLLNSVVDMVDYLGLRSPIVAPPPAAPPEAIPPEGPPRIWPGPSVPRMLPPVEPVPVVEPTPSLPWRAGCWVLRTAGRAVKCCGTVVGGALVVLCAPTPLGTDDMNVWPDLPPTPVTPPVPPVPAPPITPNPSTPDNPWTPHIDSLCAYRLVYPSSGLETIPCSCPKRPSSPPVHLMRLRECKLIGSGGCNKTKGLKRCTYTCEGGSAEDHSIPCGPGNWDPDCPGWDGSTVWFP